MKVIVPTTITDSILTSSNVPEVKPADYAAGTTYGLGDLVSTGAEGAVVTVWESLQAANTGNTPSSSPLWWLELAETYYEYAAGTTYAADAMVLVEATHTVYKSLVGSNTGNYPPTDVLEVTPKWISQGATNRWRAFDSKVGVQASRACDLVYTMLPGIITSLAGINAGGVSATAVLIDPTDGEVYNETVDLIDTGNVFDAYSYCFGGFTITDNFAMQDIPPYSGATLVLTIHSDDIATCGEIVLGIINRIGDTQYNPELRIQDFSSKVVDTFGNYTIVERAYSKRRDFKISIDNYSVGTIEKLLSGLRATPVVWVSGEDTDLASALIIYGYYRDFRIVVPYPTNSDMTLQVEGLI